MTDEKKEIITYREPTGGDAVKAFIPNDFPSVFRFSQLLAESGDMLPKAYIGNPPKIAAAIFFGYEIGLLPLQALQSIAVINGKPSIYGDAALGLVRGSGKLEEFKEYFEGGDLWLGEAETTTDGKLLPRKPNPKFKAICKIKRKGGEAELYEFSVEDAIQAGLWNKDGPWRQYTKRMLKFRARGFGLRDEFTDILRGLILTEEAEDYEMKDITPVSEDPPAPKGDDDGKPKRTRAKKDAPANQYQGSGKVDGDVVNGKVDATEAEVIDPATGEVTTETISDDPPAPVEAKVDEPKVAEKKAAPRVLEEVKKPASSEDPAHAKVMAEVMDAASTNKPLREYLTTLDVHLAPANSEQSMRELWKTRKEFEKPTKSEVEVIAKLRDYHKDRCLAADKAAADPGEDPPAPSGDQKPEFDYSDFLHNLDVELGKQKTPDDVNRVYAEWTARPLNGGIITAEQEDNDLKPLWASHLERADFGG